MRPYLPPEFEERLASAGGRNRYGQPNFRLGWSRDERFRAGGVWPHDKYAGYRNVFTVTCTPEPPASGYWMLMMWRGPEYYGGEAMYDYLHRDEQTGLCTLGPYPHRGRYEIVARLNWTYLDEGNMKIEPWPINSVIIERLVPICRKFLQESIAEKKQRSEMDRARTEQKRKAALDSMMHESRQRNLLPSQIEDRIRLMEKQWDEYIKRGKKAPSGFARIA